MSFAGAAGEPNPLGGGVQGWVVGSPNPQVCQVGGRWQGFWAVGHGEKQANHSLILKEKSPFDPTHMGCPLCMKKMQEGMRKGIRTSDLRGETGDRLEESQAHTLQKKIEKKR